MTSKQYRRRRYRKQGGVGEGPLQHRPKIKGFKSRGKSGGGGRGVRGQVIEGEGSGE